jgi:tetratricopeptide (TPR) repeat protein
MMQSGNVASIFDFTSHITERARDFTGRHWVFAEIDRWLATPGGPRYFVITGEPGIGKTALAARLTQLHDLAATHFCIAGQADTTDPLNFARSLSFQLTCLEGFAQYITSEQAVNISGQASAGQSSGPVIGVNINTLIVQAPSATIAFNRVVADPLRQLYAAGFDQQVVILVDALDEAVQLRGAETIVDLLAGQQHLPSQVRFIVTSRPQTEVLRRFEQAHILLLDAENDENIQDLRTYVRNQVETSKALQERLTEYQMQTEALIDRVVTASQGNFLYLVFLLPAIAVGTQRFDSADSLPQGLDGVYRELLRMRIARNIPSWRTTYRPVLGILAAARASLTPQHFVNFSGLSEQEIDDVLQDVQEFLEPTQARQGRYLLYHRSIAEFLGDKQQAMELWIDFVPIHRSIISFYRGEEATWEEVRWEEKDDYGLLYLSSHLYIIRDSDSYRQALYRLLCKSFLQAKYKRFGSHQSFAKDVALAIEAASDQSPPNVVEEIRVNLIYATLGSLTANSPPEALAVLAQVGQAVRAMDIAGLIQNAESRGLAYQLIGEALLARGEKEEACAIFRQELEVAKNIGLGQSKWQALGRIAQALALVGQLDEALEVVEMIEDAGDKATALGEVAAALVKIGQIDQALTVVEMIEDAEYKATALGKVALALTRAEQLDQALNVAQMIAPGFLRGIVLSRIAQALIEAGGRELARAVVSQAMASAEKIEGEYTEGMLLAEIAQALGQLGEHEQARRVADQALKAAQKVDDEGDLRSLSGEVRRQALILVARGLAQAKQFDLALVAAEASGRLDEIVQILVQAGEHERAIAVANQALIEGKFVKSFVLKSIAQVFAQAGAFDQALATIERIEDAGYKAEALDEVAQVFTQAGAFEQALATIERIEGKRSKATALGSLARALAQRGENTFAEAIANQAFVSAEVIEDGNTKMRALIEVARVLAQQGDKERGAIAASKALEVGRTLNGTDLFSSEVAITELALTFAIVGRLDQAQEAAELHQSWRTLRKVAEILLQRGEKERAIALADHAIASIEVFADGLGKAIALIEICQALMQAGEKERATAIVYQTYAMVEEIKRSKVYEGIKGKLVTVVDGTLYKVECLSDMAKILAQIGEKERAIALADQAFTMAKQLENEFQKPLALIAVTEAFTQAEQFEQAQVVLDAIERFSDRMEALSKIIKGLIRIGEKTRASALVKQCLKKSKVILEKYGAAEAASTVTGVLNRLADALLEVGEKVEAGIVASHAWEVAKEIAEDKFGKSTVLERLALILIQVGQLEQVLQIVELIRGGSDRIDTLQEIGKALAKAGQLDQALEVVEMIEDAGDKATALGGVAAALVRIGQTDRALEVVEMVADPVRKTSVLGLGETIRALTEKGCFDQAMQQFRKALAIARAGRGSVFAALECGAATLSSIDQGKSLWRVYEIIEEIDSWWGAK